MIVHQWQPERDAEAQLDELLDSCAEPGVLVVSFPACRDGQPLPWSRLEPWTRSRAVTVADGAGDLLGPGLEVALCCDLVYLREGAAVRLPPVDRVPAAGLVWALARAGRRALARGLLHGSAISAAEAVSVGLAQAVVAGTEPLPLPEPCSVVALTATRDLMRTRSPRTPSLELELATFQLLYAADQPQEGARAFLENRDPDFEG